MSGVGKPAPWDVLEEHLDDAEGLLVRWHEVADDGTMLLDELRDGYEARLIAHLDALDIGGDGVFERLLAPALFDEESTPSRAAAAALALLLSPDRKKAADFISRLSTLAAPAQAGASIALAMFRSDDLAKPMAAVLGAADPTLRAGLLGALTLRGDGAHGILERVMVDEHPAVRTAALRAAVGADRRLQPWIDRALTSNDPQVRDAAVYAGLSLGSESAWVSASHLALAPGTVHIEAMLATAMFGEPRQIAALIGRLGEPLARPTVLRALGFSGRTSAADACVAMLADPELGVLAGEAFVAITGLDARDARYWKSARPASAAAVVGGDDDPPSAVQQPQDAPPELPVPLADAIGRWWAEHRGRFSADQRYLLGRPADHGSLANALRCEPLRRRHARAFELIVRTRGQARVHTRMLAVLQLRELGAAGSWPRIDGSRSYSRIA